MVSASLLQDIRASKDKITLSSQSILQAHTTFTTQSTELIGLIETLDAKVKELEAREAAVEKRENEARDKIQQVQDKERKCTEKEKKIEEREKVVAAKETKWTETEKRMQQNATKLPNIIHLNISGARFSFMKDSLLKYKGSLFEEMMASDHSPLTASGELFIARSPTNFHHIVDFLLNGTVNPSTTAERLTLESEFAYYKLPFLLKHLLPGHEGNENNPHVHVNKIKEWLPGKRFQLLYKATTHGFAAAEFHKLCDNKGPTLSVIQSSNGYLFGGYTTASWDSLANFRSSTEAFLYTLTSPHNIPATKYNIVSTVHSIYCHPNYGPTFVDNHDISVANNANENHQSYTNFYNSTFYTDTTGKGGVTFTGAKDFTVSEVEVFSVFN